MKITPYVPGRSIEEVQKELGAKRWIKLASNENLLGPSPKAIRAIQKELSNIYLYPEGPCTVLRQALARKFSLPERRVVVSNGADNLILMIANAFVDEGDEVVMADPTFQVYTNVTQMMGGRSIKLRLKNFTHDLDSMLSKVNRKTKLIFICNPNNPTGTIVSDEAFHSFLSELPARVIVVLDEAYGDFVDDPSCPNGLDYIKRGAQVIVLRTFSKVYGLAGLRIGYGLGREDLINCLYQVRDPFPVHRLAQVAALAALKDREHRDKSVQLIHEGSRQESKVVESVAEVVHLHADGPFDFISAIEELVEAFPERANPLLPTFHWPSLRSRGFSHGYPDGKERFQGFRSSLETTIFRPSRVSNWLASGGGRFARWLGEEGLGIPCQEKWPA